MFAFIIYELKVAVILAAFYLCFKCFLCKEKMHRMNRIVLVVTSVLSFVLPLCIITIHKTVPMAEPLLSGMPTSTGAEIPAGAAMEKAGAFPWKTFIISAYWTGVLYVLASIAYGVVHVLKVIRKGEVKDLYGTDVTVCDGDVPPFSWMKWIVMSKTDFECGNHHILEHEKAHIRLGHSKEVLLFDVMSAFQWFNPAMWLLKRDLRAIHEYEADDAVLRAGADIKEYQYSLIRKAVSASGYSITNSFNHSILKNRITMMSKSNSSMARGLKALYVIPLVAVALACNSRTVTEYKGSENSEQSDAVVLEIKKTGSEYFGDYVCFVDGEKTAYDEIGPKVKSSVEGKSSKTVTIAALSEAKCGVIEDINRSLRQAAPLIVRYSCPDLKQDMARSLPPSGDNASQKQDESSETIAFSPVEKSREHNVVLHADDTILYDSDPCEIGDLMANAVMAIRENHHAIFCFECHRNTSYGMFVTAQNEIHNAVIMVREEYAQSTFGKALDKLGEDDYKAVLDEIPINILQLEMKK